MFFKHGNLKIITLPVGENIYMLWKKLKADDFDTDIIEVLRESNKKIREQLEGLSRDDFSEVFLFFDYDVHQTNLGKADDGDVINQMLESFDNETENGKLYISYPMVEALRDFEAGKCGNGDNCFVEISDLAEYKNISLRNSLNPHFRDYNIDVWKEIVDVLVKVVMLSKGGLLMRKMLLVAVSVMIILIVSGCGASENNDTIENTVVTDKADVDTILENQKIVFIMSISSYSEPYAEGYFVDANGKKHIYRLHEQPPFDTIEAEYAYLLEHYDEFEIVDFFDDATLRTCTEYLYHVNSDSKINSEGVAIMDFPLKQLYGIRMLDGKEEFVWLGSETGISSKLEDQSAIQIFEVFGDEWYLLE